MTKTDDEAKDLLRKILENNLSEKTAQELVCEVLMDAAVKKEQIANAENKQ